MLRITPLMLKIFLVSIVLFLPDLIITKQIFSQGDQKVRVGIVYISSTTGFRYRDGIINILSDTSKYHIIEKPYILASHGEDTVKKLIRNNEVDVILGPTESDVFTSVYKTDGISDNKICVISGLATTNVGNDSQGFFFRLNLEATNRVFEVWSYMNKFWVSKVAIIYADSEFGRNAEMAFSKLIRDSYSEMDYMNISFESPLIPIPEISKIIEERPEVIGLFCEREDIDMLYQNIQKLNSTGVPYNPAFFTIIDITTVGSELKNFYFPSLQDYADFSKIDAGVKDEVYILGQATGTLLQKALAKSGPDNHLKTPPERLSFRNHVVGILLGETNADTSMKFLKMKNLSPPHLYKLNDSTIYKIDQKEEIHWLTMVKKKVSIIYATQSYKLILNLTLMLILTISVSTIEIRRSFPKKHVKIYYTTVFYYYLLVHLFLVLFLYIYLAETGRINYYDTLMVIIISITPTAFFKVTFFETRSGRSFGLEAVYKRVMALVEAQIMNARYKKLAGLENVIAYYNSLDGMKTALLRIYRNNPSKVQSAKLIQKMEEELTSEGDYMNRRRAAARMIMRQFDREQLKAEGFVPNNWEYDKSIDPIILIRHAAKYCSLDDTRKDKVFQLHKTELDALGKRNAERFEEINSVHQKELSITMSKEGILLVKLRMLMVLRGFSLNWLLENGLIDKEEVERLRKNKRLNSLNEKNIIKKILSKFGSKPQKKDPQQKNET